MEIKEPDIECWELECNAKLKERSLCYGPQECKLYSCPAENYYCIKCAISKDNIRLHNLYLKETKVEFDQFIQKFENKVSELTEEDK